MNLPVSLTPLTSRLRAKIGRHDAELPGERIELAPAWTSDRPAAFCLPGEFDRASGFFMQRDMEKLRIDGGRRPEGATTAVVVQNAIVGGGAVYAAGRVDAYRDDAARLVLRGPTAERGEALLATSKCAERYFGDWLVEAPSLELIAADRGLPAVGFAEPTWMHVPGYRAIFGLSAEAHSRTLFERLWVVDDRGLNEYRAARFNELRRRIRGAAGSGGSALVYLSRGQMGRARDVANAGALEEELAKRGFAIVKPEQEEPAALTAKLANAELVVGVEGSAHVHAVLAMPATGMLVDIQPPHRFTASGKDMADMAGIGYGFVVADAVEEGFAVDIARLMRTLDLITSRR